MPATIFDARKGSGVMEVDGTRARTAQEARLKEPKDSPTKKRASNDVILQYDLAAGDENTGATDDDELAHAAGTPVAKAPPPKGAHRRHSDSPDFGREVPGTKHPISVAAPPRYAGDVSGATTEQLTGVPQGSKRGSRTSSSHKTMHHVPPGLAARPAQTAPLPPKANPAQLHVSNSPNLMHAPGGSCQQQQLKTTRIRTRRGSKDSRVICRG